MRPDDMILVSVDDHLVEPPNLFDGRVATNYADEVNGAIIPDIGLNAVAGHPREEYGIEPTAFDEMRPGCYDIDERIKDMDAGGVLGSMCFPSFPGFAGRLFATHPDKDLAFAVTQAYNDWHIDEWCGPYPGRKLNV